MASTDTEREVPSWNKHAETLLHNLQNYDSAVLMSRFEPRVWGKAGMEHDGLQAASTANSLVDMVKNGGSLQVQGSRYIKIKTYSDSVTSMIAVHWTPSRHMDFSENDRQAILHAFLLFKRGVLNVSKDVFLNLICPHIAETLYIPNQNVDKQFYLFKNGPRKTLAVVTTKQMIVAIHKTTEYGWSSPDMWNIERLHQYTDYFIQHGF